MVGEKMIKFEESDLILATKNIHRAIKDQGKSPQYHRYQMERLRLEWPTLSNAILHLVDVIDGLERNGSSNQPEHDGYSSSKT